LLCVLLRLKSVLFMLELIHELILLVTHLKYYDGPNCDLIKI